MMNKIRSIFMLFLVCCFTLTLYADKAKEAKEIESDFHEAVVKMEKNGSSPTHMKFLEDAELTVENFFTEYQKFYGFSADNDMKVLRSHEDAMGKHHRFDQYYKGVKVFGAQYVLHERESKVWMANGHLVHGLKVDVSPKVSEEAALEAALKHIGAKSYMWEAEENEAFLKAEQGDENATFYPQGELMLTSGGHALEARNMVLTYRFDIYAEYPRSRDYIFVDAHTGKIVNKIPRIHHVDVAGSGASLYNGTVNMTVDEVSSNSYRLRQSTTRAAAIETYDMQNGTSYTAAADFTATSASGTWDAAGVSGHFGAEATYDYFFNNHGRNSVDDAGFTLLSYIHTDLIGFGYPNNINAFWDGSRMTYGDGDGVNYTELVTLDICSHELTHGVTDFSSDLIYQGESGALNESFSDIFGNLVEFEVQGDPGVGTGNWRVGEQMTTNGLGIRNMENPNEFSDPDTYNGTHWAPTGPFDFDNGGVHINSGVQNFWFYLLMTGGTGTNDNGYAYNVVAISKQDAASIAYHNNNSFLTPSSNYDDARTGAIDCAEQLFGVGSQQALSTAEAWLAVGVGTVPQPPAEYATLPFTEGFEAGSFGVNWNTYTSNNFGRVQVTTANTPAAGSYHMTMDVTTNNNFSTQEAWLHLDLSGESQVTLDFQWKDFADETHTQDGVYFSDNGGTTFTKVQDLNGASYTNNVWNSFSLDVDDLASTNGLSLTSTFIIKFQQYDNYVIATDGHAYDEISVTGDGGGNVAPTAEANGPYDADINVSINFSSAGSNDTDGTISSYSWDFGDGGSSTDANPSYSYATAGTYTATLTVTDDGGLTAEDEATVTITDPGSGGTGDWVELAYDDFESGWGSYVDGGSDCRRSANDAAFAWEGTYCARIRDNSTSSNFTTGTGLNLTGYDELRFDFYFYPRTLEAGEGFVVELNDGSGWVVVGDYQEGVHFTNGSFWHESGLIVSTSVVSSLSDVDVRFRCTGTVNNDRVYMDAIRIEGRTNSTIAGLIAGGSGSPATIPLEYALAQNFPNPFNPTTTISFSVPQESEVSIKIYDINGSLVKTLVNEHKAVGTHSQAWDGRNDNGVAVSSGIYIYRMVSGSFEQSRRLIMLK